MKKIISVILVILLLTLAGCGGSAKGDYSYAAAEEAVMTAPAEAPAAAENGKLTSASGGGSSAIPENRQWIITIHMSAETEDLDTMTAALDEKITSLGGYVENQNIYNGSAYSSRRYRSASLTIRIPADKVDQFTEQISGIANVVRQEKSMEDITLRYVDTESRVTALKTEEARLLELLAKAETMTDLLEIEARLTDVRYELENHSSRLRTYDNQVDYATIHLDISEVQEYTPVEDPTLWERISGGFTDSLEGLWESLQDLLVLLIVVSPYLVVYGGIGAVVILIVRRMKKTRKPRKAFWKKAPKSDSGDSQ